MKHHQEITYLTERGTLTLPAKIRDALGLKGKQQFLVNVTERGEIVLRPAVTMPIEYYTEARIAEFSSEEIVMDKWLKVKVKPKKK